MSDIETRLNTLEKLLNINSSSEPYIENLNVKGGIRIFNADTQSKQICTDWNNAKWSTVKEDWESCDKEGEYLKNPNALAKCVNGTPVWQSQRNTVYNTCNGGNLPTGPGKSGPNFVATDNTKFTLASDGNNVTMVSNKPLDIKTNLDVKGSLKVGKITSSEINIDNYTNGCDPDHPYKLVYNGQYYCYSEPNGNEGIGDLCNCNLPDCGYNNSYSNCEQSGWEPRFVSDNVTKAWCPAGSCYKQETDMTTDMKNRMYSRCMGLLNYDGASMDSVVGNNASTCAKIAKKYGAPVSNNQEYVNEAWNEISNVKRFGGRPHCGVFGDMEENMQECGFVPTYERSYCVKQQNNECPTGYATGNGETSHQAVDDINKRFTLISTGNRGNSVRMTSKNQLDMYTHNPSFDALGTLNMSIGYSLDGDFKGTVIENVKFSALSATAKENLKPMTMPLGTIHASQLFLNSVGSGSDDDLAAKSPISFTWATIDPETGKKYAPGKNWDKYNHTDTVIMTNPAYGGSTFSTWHTVNAGGGGFFGTSPESWFTGFGSGFLASPPWSWGDVLLG